MTNNILKIYANMLIAGSFVYVFVLIGFFTFNIGLSIFIFFYFKRENIAFLLIAFGIEFKDIIFPFLYLIYFVKLKIILSILQILLPFISLGGGIYVYINDSNDSIDEGEYKTLELKMPNAEINA